MSTSFFLKPRFIGPRFDEHTLPLEVLKDLQSFQDFVIAVAKHLFLEDNDNRIRVPKGFASDFHIHLQKIEEGSTKTVLALFLSGLLALEDGSPSYFDRAKDLIAECVDKGPSKIPASFPKPLLNYFNTFGRSLLPNESLELPYGSDGKVAVLTPEKRKELVLTISKEVEQEIEIIGTIGEIDWDKSKFRLNTIENMSLDVGMPTDYKTIIKDFGGRARHAVWVSGIAQVSRLGKITRIKEVTEIGPIPNFELHQRIEQLASLQNGWFEGGGLAPDRERLIEIYNNLLIDLPENIPLPRIFPKQDGNLLLEWSHPDDPSLDIELDSFNCYFHAFSETGRDIEKDFILTQKQQWKELLDFIVSFFGEVRL